MKCRQWLIDARRKLNITQEDLAKTIGVSRSAYVRYENGERTPSPETASKIGNALNVDKTKFFWDE